VQVGVIWLPDRIAPQSREDRGRRPHVPSSIITMSKSQPRFRKPASKKPDTEGSPIFLPEESVSRHVGDQTAETLGFPSGEGASRPVL
jgi:hypothetical protein